MPALLIVFYQNKKKDNKKNILGAFQQCITLYIFQNLGSAMAMVSVNVSEKIING